MLPVVLLAQIGKRLGLGKQVVRFGLRRLLSLDMKQKAFAGYRPTSADVIVATFAKSGTNWMMQIAELHRLGSDFPYASTFDVR